MTFNTEDGWDSLDYWDSAEWHRAEERLDDYIGKGTSYNPRREDLFAALDLSPFKTVRCAIIGQDPYPDARFSTGVAFSIPSSEKQRPASLLNIFSEYETDLHYPTPATGNLASWTSKGVLLWNTYPTCETNKAGSHHWTEWEALTKEIVERLSERGIVFAFLGRKAQEYAKYVTDRSEYINVSHPSPLGVNATNNPFKGSRLFTTINDCICTNKLGSKIDWRLD